MRASSAPGFDSGHCHKKGSLLSVRFQESNLLAEGDREAFLRLLLLLLDLV
jgi:hypothetical protein